MANPLSGAGTAEDLLVVRGLRKSYGSTLAIDRVDLTVRQGEFVSVVGPSGCGKTTLLNCISGLLRPTEGGAVLSGRPITSVPRELAIVFQDYSRSLFPWFTVRGNVELPQRDLPKAERRQLAERTLATVGLARFQDHYPWQLSGGMQQRVAIARALAYRPSILVMDEPFASVDAQTRADLEDLVLRIQQEYSATVLLVTHDIDEAVYMSDRVVILTSSPASVRGELPITLPWPRHQIETKELAEFAHLRAAVYRQILSPAERDAGPVAGDRPVHPSNDQTHKKEEQS